MQKIALGVLMYFAVSVPVAFAGPIIRSGETVSIDATQNLQDDFYGFGSVVTISGTADDDVYVGAGDITINAPIAHDLSLLGGTVQVHGDVGDDLRVLGGEVTVGKPVKGDVVVLGGTLTILSTASIDGDLIFLGEKLTVEGPVKGAIHGTADQIRINSEIGGDVLVTATTQMALGDKADVKGNVTYESGVDMLRAQDAHVGGDVRKVMPQSEGGKESLRFFLMVMSIVLFGSLALWVVARRRVMQAITDAYAHIGTSGLIGMLVFIATPFVSIMFMVSMLGLLAGVLLIAFYLVLIVSAYLLVIPLLGHAFETRVMGRTEYSLQTMIIGTLGILVLALVPFVGPFILFACFLVALGSLIRLIVSFLR